MNTAALALSAALAAAILIFGKRLLTGRRDIYAVSLVTALYVAFFFLPEIPAILLPPRLWGAFLFPAAIVPLSLVITVTDKRVRSRTRAMVYVVTAGLVGVFMSYSSLQGLFVDYGSVNGIADSTGYCVQSTLYTCGAAAGVMLLHRAGVSVDERTIAEYCGSSRGAGTNIFLLYAYFRKHLGTKSDRNIIAELAHYAAMAEPDYTGVAPVRRRREREILTHRRSYS
jgi:hypothetical protein